LVWEKLILGDEDVASSKIAIPAIDLTIMEEGSKLQFAMRVFWVTLGIVCTALGTALLMILLR
jgi:hypothetical protein